MSTARFRMASAVLLAAIVDKDGNPEANPRILQRAFSVFATATQVDWEKLAGSILRRYKVGPDVAIEDVIQELLTACYKYMSGFDATRGTQFADFLVFQSMARAKKWVHRARGANLHNPDRNKSRLPIKLEDLLATADGQSNALPNALRVPADQESILAASRVRDVAMRSLRTLREYEAFNAFWEAGGDITEATNMLVEDLEQMRALKITGEDQARSIILKTVGIVKKELVAV